ncbi:putative iron-sulfur cluster-binding metallochaperone [Deinococcus radiomollis]|uniref:putative iron-sulfur cluster-binding metallochaperone n=1 Tax=Deinococcus radiomollis TaxID=468916 RepID=UPI003891B986
MPGIHTLPERSDVTMCPVTHTPGQPVKLVTLKALLRPQALQRLSPAEAFQFCPDHLCDVVYFSPTQVFRVSDVKVPVFQKNDDSQTPACYCFGITREEMQEARDASMGAELIARIKLHIQAGRCGCEVNNPQGRCCLGNVTLAMQPS